MRIGLVIGLHDSGSDGGEPPRWEEISSQAQAAEQAGFDLIVVEDALTFNERGNWESIAMMGALATGTSHIELSHSVINASLRRAAVIARAADTLDEISGGRYSLGIGAGNTPDDFRDYAIPVDRKFSRFEEKLAVIHSLLKSGHVDFDGEFETAHSSYFGPRGPRPDGPPIIVAGKGPRVIRMCARYADGWNWWGDSTDATAGVPELVTELERACEEVGRDPASIQRSLDLYSYDILGRYAEDEPWVHTGPPSRIAESILSLGEMGIDEVRCDVIAPPDQRGDAAAAMAEVVALVHAG